MPDTYTQPAEAQRAATHKEDELRRRPAAKKRGRTMTWGQWCDQWEPNRDVEPGTSARDRQKINRHIRPRWETNHSAKSIAAPSWSGAMISQLHQSMAAREHPLAPRTVLRIVRLFSTSMRAAFAEELIDYNPCVELGLDQGEEGDEYFLTHQEFGRLISVADELTTIISHFGVGVGPRWGEIAGFHRRRLDLPHKRVLIKEIFDKETCEIKPYPKGRKRRGQPITDELTARLQTWVDTHPPIPCRAKHRDNRPCNDSLLFPSRDGTPLHYQNFRRRHWDLAVQAAGLSGATPHDLRHTYASWAIQSKKITLDQLAVLMGHKDRSTTQRYAHFGEINWDDVRAAFSEGAAGSEAALIAQLQQLAAEDPQRWQAALEAAKLEHVPNQPDSIEKNLAPHLPHDDQDRAPGKLIRVDFRGRSTAT